jgi:3' terminal RNA ribose 2'-O-methyltransferase Hen1
MLLTITTTHTPATDLGYLLHKNPARPQSFELSFGQAHVFYPEVSETRCTAAMLLHVDPIGLVRNRRGPAGNRFSLDQYVNDRPYIASSFLSVAIAQVYGSALSGTSRERPDLAKTPIPLEAKLSVIPCRGETFVRSLFEPLGYDIDLRPFPLDEHFPEWGESVCAGLTLRATKTLESLLSHLYVLIPVLDNDKHYWVGEDEVAKLLRHGEGWLSAHPQREAIARRYLKHQSRLTRSAMAALVDEEDPDAAEEAHDQEEQEVERPLSLNQQRLGSVVAALRSSGARRILDLGCGEGSLIRELLRDKAFEEILGVDVSIRALETAADRLNLDRLPPTQRARVNLIHGSLTYRDKRLAGYDAAAIVEVIEHLDPPRLAALERVVFEFARPRTAIITTPNSEYNVKWETLPAGEFRHRDHRFEWTRAQFRAWAIGVAARHGYGVRFVPVGPEDATVGAPTQMGVFTR